LKIVLKGSTRTKIDLSGLSMTEKRVMDLCLSNKCAYDFETCPCDDRKGSPKYCDNYSRMIEIYGKIRQPDLFVFA
jgi:hypothetical protein